MLYFKNIFTFISTLQISLMELEWRNIFNNICKKEEKENNGRKNRTNVRLMDESQSVTPTKLEKP